MAARPPVAPVTPGTTSGEIAQQLPSYDPAPVIAAQEQDLQDYLNLPVREILARLNIAAPPEPTPDNAPQEQPPGDPQQGMPFDPMSLISPVTDALGTLGTGLFEGVDPTQLLAGIAETFGATATPLQRAVGSLDQVWRGAGGTAAAAKSTKAIANGTEVAAQSEALRTSLTAATAQVAQARARLIAIASEFAATIAAIGPNIIFPWGWAAAIAAANKAIASTAEVMTELQASLGVEAAEVTAAGAPVDVTTAPSLGTSPFALASPLMSMATKAAQSGIQAGTGAASAAQQAAAKSTAGKPAGASKTTGAPAGGGRGGGVGAIASGGTPALRSISTSPMVQPDGATSNQSAPVRAGAANTAMGGAGMIGAPYGAMAGQGANSSSSGHNPASFLHTSDQGGQIVGDLGTAAPPVLGEADPSEAPDVELRI